MPRKIFTPDEGLGEFDYNDVDAEALLRMGDEGFAAVYPPPGSDELFDDQFTRRARELTRQPSNLQPVNVLKQRSGAWTGNNQLGIEVPFADDANNKQTILKLDEWDFPQVWSVHLYLKTQRVVTPFNIIAQVNAGVGGATNEFEVDWNKGTTFSVVTNALNIIASFDTAPVLTTDIRLGVIVGFRSLPGARPTRTIPINVVTGDTQIITIPKYAQAVRFLTNSLSLFTSDALLVFRNFNIVASIGGDEIASVGGATGVTYNNYIPIPGGANTLEISNSNVKAAIGLAIFDLNL